MLNGKTQTLYAFAEQEGKVPVDQPLHIISRGEGNLALVILIIEIKRRLAGVSFFCFVQQWLTTPGSTGGKGKLK